MTTAVSSSARATSLLILSQLLSRAATFAINQALLRFLAPATLGLAAQLELYSLTVLYFARDSIRVALQRAAGRPQAAVNVAYLEVALAAPLAAGVGALYLSGAHEPLLAETVVLYGVAAGVEVLAEPFFAVAQLQLAYGTRAAAETAATIARCLVTFGAIAWTPGGDRPWLPAFGLGQLAYSITLLLVYVLRFSRVKDASFSVFPRRLEPNLALNLYLQSGIKYLLTQGDGLLIAALASLEAQGAYALASNYGGLIARVLFQPVEESSRNLFAKLCAPDTEKESNAVLGKKKSEKTISEKTISDSRRRNISQAADLLQRVLKLYSLLGLLAMSLGPVLAPQLLYLLAGSKWATSGDASPGAVLAAYAYYIPLLAFNGVGEAFVSAVATGEQLRVQSIAMGVNSVVFAAAAWGFLGFADMGARGLVWANCVNMGARILYNSNFIKAWFRENGQAFSFSTVLPMAGSVASAVALTAVARAADNPLMGKVPFANLTWPLSLTGALVVLLVAFERHFLKNCYRLVSKR